MSTAPQEYDIFSEIKTEIDDFDTEGYYLVGEPKTEVKYKGASRSKGAKGGYYYSQKDLYDSIDLASASKYKKGIKDKEGQRKTYINIVNFYRDVMKMKILIRVSNYIFEPTSLDFVWPVWLLARKFTSWAQDESYDDQIEEYAHDLSTYGSCVTKKCVGGAERVPLRTMRNTQSAKSLWHAASTGGYVIIEDDKHYNEMEAYPGWILKDVEVGKSHNVFERYALVPKRMVENDAWKENGGKLDDFDEAKDEMVVAFMVMICEERDDGKGFTGKLVFMEKVNEETFPLEEAHTERIDGRWAGRGEIEKQLENQIARNLTANLRRRGLLWATKKIYQSSDDEVAKQLLMEVADGEVVYVKPNGQISQVNTSNQHLGEFNADEESWKENSQQQAFAFNIATGENLPSGTSFSLGVVLDRAVSSHFGRVRGRFSNFLRRSFFDQIMISFRDDHKDEHTQSIPMGATDIENLKQQFVTFHLNLRLWDAMLDRKKRRRGINPDELRTQVLDELVANPWMFVEIPEEFYPNAHYYMKLNLDEDIGPDINTLTTVWQNMEAKGDPRADNVLNMIMAKQGKNMSFIAGGGGVKPVPPADPNTAALPAEASGGPAAPDTAPTQPVAPENA